MVAKTAELLVLLSLKKEGFDKGVKSTKSNLKDMGKSFLGATAAIAGTGAAIYLAGKQIYDVGKRGAIVTQTADSFDFLSQKLGLAPDLLDQLRTSARGTIPDMQLMSSTATLLAGTTDELGKALGDSTPQLMEIAKAANKLNPSLGTTAHMYDSLALGIKRASPMILDNLGLTIKIGTANEKYAEQIGKTVDQLSAEDKQIALLNATLEAGDNLINQVGGSTESTTDAFAIMETNAANLKDELAKGLSPAIADLVTWGNDLVSGLNDQQGAYDLLTTAMEDNIITSDEYDQLMVDLLEGTIDLSDATEIVTDKTEDWREEMGLTEDQIVELTGHERAYIEATEDAETATDEFTGALADEKGAADLLNISMQTYTEKLLFNMAAAYLDADAAFTLAGKMGLVDQKTVDAYKAVEYLTGRYDENKDGAIDAAEGADDYISAILTVGESVNTAGGHMHTATGKAFALRREIELLRDKSITITTNYVSRVGTGPPGARGGRSGSGGGGSGGVGTPPPPPPGSRNLPPGAQHGLSMTVPSGYPNDTFPIFVSSGELVNVFTKGQQDKFSNLSGAMSFGGSNIKPKWQEAIEESGETFSGDIEESGTKFSDDTEKAGDSFGIFINEAGYTFGIDTRTAGEDFSVDTRAAGYDFGVDTRAAGYDFSVDTGAAGAIFGIDTRAAGASFGFDTGSAGHNFAVSVGYAGDYFIEDVRRAGEAFARAVIGFPPSPSPPPPRPPLPPLPPLPPPPPPKPPKKIGELPPPGPGQLPPGVIPPRPPPPKDIGGIPIPPPKDIGGIPIPPPPPPRIGGIPLPTNITNYNYLNIYTNAPVEADVPDLLLLRAWASG